VIYLISGLHDIRWLDNILANYKRQLFPCKLLIVENGTGLGATSHIDDADIYVTRSDTGVSNYINAGLTLLKAISSPGDWFCKFDSDDYYGPEYVSQIASQTLGDSDYAGRNSLYIKTKSNHLWYLEGTSTSVFHGPTLAGRISTVLYFRQVTEWGEDAKWCHDMNSAGYRASIIRPEGFCYQRWDDYSHIWPCSDLELRTSWLRPILDLGNFDLEIVNGHKSKSSGIILDVPEITPDTFMPFRIIKEKSLSVVGV
jgi:hypothetical protein